jgi:hypothetical protein
MTSRVYYLRTCHYKTPHKAACAGKMVSRDQQQSPRVSQHKKAEEFLVSPSMPAPCSHVRRFNNSTSAKSTPETSIQMFTA